jgi:uncharacterized RDD family membrane protein YckC
MTADEYVNRVLDSMPPTMPNRAQIAAELRSHIAERLEHGHELDEVLRQLGDPATLANSYLSAEPLVSAPFLSRAFAKLIDLVCVLVVLCPAAWLLSQLAPPDFRPIVMLCLVAVGGSVSFGLYTIAAEYRRGQTIGKRLRGIRVVRETGARISVGQAIVRQLPMFLQVYWVDVMFALFTERGQRAFEMLSKTRVVRAVPALVAFLMTA